MTPASFEENSYAAITGYKGTSTDGYESWLITPPLNFDAMAQKVLSFQSQAAYSGTDKLEVFVMTTADPSTAGKLTDGGHALECGVERRNGINRLDGSVAALSVKFIFGNGLHAGQTEIFLNEEPSDGIADGDGSKESPYSPAQVMGSYSVTVFTPGRPKYFSSEPLSVTTMPRLPGLA